MSDNLSPIDRQRAMKAVKGKGTKPERQLWAMLAGMGISGWRKNANDIAGKPDIVFDKRKIVIFIDGCFWHKCPYCKRPLPKTNIEYWEQKIKRNVLLANQYVKELNNNGWLVIRFWEHEIKSPNYRKTIKKRLAQVLLRKNYDPI